jgi:hypothetical protein
MRLPSVPSRPRRKCADLPLELQHLLRRTLRVIPLCDAGQQPVDDRGYRLHSLAAGSIADQHDREVVAQRREIAITGKERGK